MEGAALIPVSDRGDLSQRGLIDHWHKWSRCRGLGTDLFFPGENSEGDNEVAKALCAQCPVVKECLRHALINHEQHGIWGGLTLAERRKARLPRVVRWRTLRS